MKPGARSGCQDLVWQNVFKHSQPAVTKRVLCVSVVIERSIEDQLRRADRDDYYPYLLPGVSIACYDSRVTNLAQTGSVVGGVAGVALMIP